MTRDAELSIQQQLSFIIKKLEAIECKIDRIMLPEQPLQDDSIAATEVDRIKAVQEKISEALARERAKAVAEMNENS